MNDSSNGLIARYPNIKNSLLAKKPLSDFKGLTSTIKSICLTPIQNIEDELKKKSNERYNNFRIEPIGSIKIISDDS